MSYQSSQAETSKGIRLCVRSPAHHSLEWSSPTSRPKRLEGQAVTDWLSPAHPLSPQANEVNIRRAQLKYQTSHTFTHGFESTAEWRNW